MSYKIENLILFVTGFIALQLIACRPDCDHSSPEIELPISVSLNSDTISVGDSIRIVMEFGRFIESPDHNLPLDLSKEDLHIHFNAARLDTIAGDDYILRYDNSIAFDLVQGKFWSEALLSKNIAPVFLTDIETHILEFDLVFTKPGVYFGNWFYNWAIEDDEISQMSCSQEALWIFTLEEGDSNFHLNELVPEEATFWTSTFVNPELQGHFAVAVVE